MNKQILMNGVGSGGVVSAKLRIVLVVASASSGGVVSTKLTSSGSDSCR